MKKNKLSGLPEYKIYWFGWKDFIEFGMKTVIKAVFISYLFYDSCMACLLLWPFSIVDYKAMKNKRKKERLRRLTLQFKAMIESMATSLNAGYSMEMAVSETKRDLELVFDIEEDIFKELDGITAGLRMNVPLEILLKDFGMRSGIEDIQNFANVVTVAKRSGGNLIRIIQKTVNSISDKIAVEEEIETLITAKKYEQKIMMVMPYGILLYMRLTNGGFFDALYHNAFGIIVMTVFLIFIYFADIWAEKIMEIQV